MAYNAKKAAEKQLKRAQAATSDYQQGIQDVTVNPMEKAAKKKDKMRQNVLAAIDDGRWEEGLKGVSLGDWQSVAINKGGRNYASGVADAEPKINAFHEEFSRYVSGVQAKLDTMPDLTPEQRDQKMLENARQLRKFKKSRRR